MFYIHLEMVFKLHKNRDLAWTLASAWRSYRQVVLAADAHYNIYYRRHYGRKRPFEVRKRWQHWTPAAMILVELEVCMAADGLMCITSNNLFECGRPDYLNIWKPTSAPTIYVLSILEVGAKEWDQFLFTCGRENTRGLPLDVIKVCLADDDSVLHTIRAIRVEWSAWRAIGKEHSGTATMGK